MDWLKSRRFQYLASLLAIWMLMLVALRAIFYFGFSEVGDIVHPSFGTLAQVLYVGVKFDLRLSLLVLVPVALASLLPWNITNSVLARRLTHIYLALAVFLCLMFYILDFGHYAYLGIRMNSTILRFFDDIVISATMAWQSYPVIWINLAWVFGTVIFFLSMKRSALLLTKPETGMQKKHKVVGVVVIFAFFFFGIFGRLGSTMPLRWNDAFFTGNPSIAALGINPVLNFTDSFKYRFASKYDEATVRDYYPSIAEYLGVEEPDSVTLNYTRRNAADNQDATIRLDKQPNIIMVMLESLGASRLGVYGHPLKPSPNLDQIANEGWFFPNFYVPVSGTARTVFASLTGLPDVSTVRTASRNQMITEQHSVVNAFVDYPKYYFIGGAAGWANMSAVLRTNIKGLNLYEEGSYDSPDADVWGISDLDLFKESNAVLKTLPKDKPFYAYIQTAGNHRPFTIPSENDGFETIHVPEEELRKFGYKNNEQFNAVRLLDFNIGRFMEMAKSAGYFENTIFAFYGDHNNRITTTPHMKPFYEALDLDGLHVPFMFYAPGLIGQRRVEAAASLVDVLPTLADFAGVPFDNTTMGRSLNQPIDEDRAVYTQTSSKTSPIIGAVTKDFMLRMNFDSTDIKLHDLNSDTPRVDVTSQDPEKAESLSRIARGIYETTKWMFHHNKHLPQDK
ncbi:hypothetical protein A9Q81_24090 [Gammaproteobacteria bacterium 42_54_T18]|nr:hypothetical protein A9Q81_24090 [Gammaproteobacteria bacterium 42_54_T18]